MSFAPRIHPQTCKPSRQRSSESLMCNFRGGSITTIRSTHTDSFAAGWWTHWDGLGSSCSMQWRMEGRHGWHYADTATDQIRCANTFCLLAISWRWHGTLERSPAYHGRHSSRTSRSPMTPWSTMVRRSTCKNRRCRCCSIESASPLLCRNHSGWPWTPLRTRKGQ